MKQEQYRPLGVCLRLLGIGMVVAACALAPRFVVARALPAGQVGLREGFIRGLWILRILLGGGGAILAARPRLLLGLLADSGIPCVAADDRPWSWLEGGFLSVLVLGAFALRIPGIDQSFTFDESFLVDALITKNPIRIFFHPSGSSHALHTVFSNLCVTLFGLSETVVRLPALLSGALAPAALYVVARCRSRAVAVLAGAILALTPCHVWYSQEAKGNAPLVLVVLLSWVCLCALQRRWRWQSAVGYVVCLFLAGMTHLSGVVVVFGQLLAALLGATLCKGDERRLCLRVSALHVPPLYLVTVLYSPILPFLTGRGETMSAIEGAANLSAVMVSVWRDFTALNVGAGYALVLVPFFLLGIAALWRTRRLLLLNATVPLLLSLVLVKVAGLFSYSRYQMFFLPGLVLLVSAGIITSFSRARRLRPALLREVLTAVCISLAAFGALGYAVSLKDYYARSKATFKSIARHLAGEYPDLPVYVPGGSKRRYPGLGFTPYFATYYTDAELSELLQTLDEDGTVAVVVADPMFLAAAYPVLNQLVAAQSFPHQVFTCHGELDQYRVQRSVVYRLPARAFRNWERQR